MALEILEPGLLTTIQDMGRYGYQRLGVPPSGAMDPFALMAANALVGNAPEAAGLEMTLLGPRLRFTDECAIAITGCELGPRLDGQQMESWAVHLVRPGTILDFTGRRSGARAYLAVSGGIAVEPCLGSRSTYIVAALGGLEGRALRAGDHLPIGGGALPVRLQSLPPHCRPPYSSEPTVRVILGPHTDRFSQEGIDTFLSGSYAITPTCDRQGYRLEGPKISHSRGPDLISCGTPLGGIQVPGNGQPIILMADHQTTGGYTMIATVIQADIPLVAQCLPGQKLRFHAVGLEEARESLQRQRDALSSLPHSRAYVVGGAEQPLHAARQAKPLGITDTVLRDSHQSLLATRMKIEDMIPAMEMLDEIGYWSLEVWGGATFDACMRFLDEDPWERLRIMKKRLPRTSLQMLLRGQNIVGYRHYADDVVESFVARARDNGMDVFRIFDALNDVRNMEPAMRAVRRVGGHVQATVCYTLSPVHNNEGFVKMAKELLQIGADSVCIKDMAGLISPYDAADLVTRLKAVTDVPISLHCHYTSGMASMAYLKAAEAGIDVVDCAISSMSLGTSQPPTETMVAAMEQTDRRTGLDIGKLSQIGKYFAGVRKSYSHLEMNIHGVDTDVLQYQIPGGMISNLVSQLREQGAESKLPDVLAEVPRVRAELGYPPLVTPSSQIVGTQAVLNVLLGGRYKMVPKEVKNVVKGMYGRTPAPIDPEVQRVVLGDEEPITCRPADLLEPEMAKAKVDIGDLARSEEDVISYVLFPQVAKEFLSKRGHKNEGLTAEQSAAIASVIAAAGMADPISHPDGTASAAEAQAAFAAPVPAGAPAPAVPRRSAAGEQVTAPLPGKVLSVAVKPGDSVSKGQELCVIEAMKMGNSIRAQREGTVREVLVAPGQTVGFDELLLVVE